MTQNYTVSSKYVQIMVDERERMPETPTCVDKDFYSLIDSVIATAH